MKIKAYISKHGKWVVDRMLMESKRSSHHTYHLVVDCALWHKYYIFFPFSFDHEDKLFRYA